MDVIGTIKHVHPIFQALIVGICTWGFAAIGASLIFVAKELNQKIFGSMLGFAAE